MKIKNNKEAFNMKNSIAINLAAGILMFGLIVSPSVRGETATQDVIIDTVK